MPNKWTFTIKPIKELLNKYVGDGMGWVDPFAGKNSPAEFTNDLNFKMPTKHHMEAEDFCNSLDGMYKGIIFDPPYSFRQVKECYESLGLQVYQETTQAKFYAKVKNSIYNKITQGGWAISFGWNTVGFGKVRGFEIIEILLVCHGGYHNDTIVTVEEKR